MNKLIAVVFGILLSVPVVLSFVLAPPAFAGLTGDLEARVTKAVADVKAAQAQQGNEPCGGYIRIEAEAVRTQTGVGEGRRIIKPETREAWGCNPNPADKQLEGPFLTGGLDVQEGATGTRYSYNVFGVLNFDRHDETAIEGRVLSRRGKPVKDALVTARDTRRNKTYPAAKTGADGRYRIMVRSGPPYEVSAEKKGCASEARTLDVCGWGPTDADPAKARRYSSFTQDLEMACKGLMLQIDAKSDAELNMAVPDGQIQGGVSMWKKGEVPLTLNEDTGEISGEAIIDGGMDTAHGSGQMNDGAGGEGQMDAPVRRQERVRVMGTLTDGEKAEMNVFFYPVSGTTTTVTNQFWDPDQGRHTIRYDASAQPDDTGLESSEQFEIIWRPGESITQRDETPSGGVVSFQEYTFTLVQDDGQPSTAAPAPAPPQTIGQNQSALESAEPSGESLEEMSGELEAAKAELEEALAESRAQDEESGESVDGDASGQLSELLGQLNI